MADRVFAMPDLGEGLDEGRIVAWLVAEGDEVALNQPLVEVETAKAAVEIPSPFAGRVTTLHGAVDEDVAVGAPLVTFEVPAEAAGETTETAAEPSEPAIETMDPVIEAPAAAVRATPAVRRLAKELGVDLTVVSGTGPDGRVTGDDVRTAASATPLEEVPTDVERMPVTATRRAIARNLERQAGIPQVTTFRTVDCAALQAFREELGVSPLPVVVAALAATVAAHPLLNAWWGGDAILLRSRIDVGLAMDTDRGLVVPVLRDAAGKAIAELATEIRRLAEGARHGSLAPDELTGATIAVSNTGSYGSEAGTPILSPGTAVTLAFGAIEPRALVTDGRVEARPAATISCTFDHRVLDGAGVGRALTELVDRLQTRDRLRDLPS